MSQKPALDYELARAIQLAVDSEAAFGIDFLSKCEPAPRLEPQSKSASQADEAQGQRVLEPVIEVLAPQETPKTAPFTTPAPKSKTLTDVAKEIAACTACSLCETRTKTVPGQGSSQARLMFVGEAPGADEDLSGEAFVGAAGQLLTKMIGAMGLSRDEVFIANILKCRPPGNRNPKPEEAQACFHFLLDQIEIVQPEVICTLGAQSTNNLLERTDPIGQLRGRTFDFHGTKLVPTYHPAYLLRDPSKKRPAWEDLQKVMAHLAGD